MCAVLQIPRSTFYYEAKAKEDETPLKEDIKRIFLASKRNYGTRKIKKMLSKEGKQISRRRIGRIMKELGLVSTYTIAQYKAHKKPTNEEKIGNKVAQEFDGRDCLEVVVSDLTYVRVDGKWNYVCLITDLYNREFIGYSAGQNKDPRLVHEAFASIRANLNKIKIFHTDRGNEFKNNTIDGLLETFEIQRSLSHKGCPYDNAVAEAAFKVFKTEFIYQNVFASLDELKVGLAAYVHWYNNIRIHSSLGYLTPVEYRLSDLKKTV
jgi:putative transposase